MGPFNGSGHAKHPKAHFTIFNIHLVMMTQVKIAKLLQCKPQSHTGEMTEHLSGTQDLNTYQKLNENTRWPFVEKNKKIYASYPDTFLGITK